MGGQVHSLVQGVHLVNRETIELERRCKIIE